MNFIKINLNQTVSKAQKDFIEQEQNRWYVFSFVCLLFVSTIIWLFFINSRMQYVIDERNNTIDRIIADTAKLKSSGQINLSKKDNQREQFEENIYHSELAERKELHLGNKWLRKKNIKDGLFKSNQSLRESIIIKEILDKPLGMRN